MLETFKKIFVGPKTVFHASAYGTYQQQLLDIKQLWNDEKTPSCGLERVFRLFLCLVQFFYPTLLIRTLAGRTTTARKLSMECYALFKLFFPVLLLTTGLYISKPALILVVYFLTETVFSVLGLIFLSDVYSALLTFNRSMILILLNYFEVTLDFSVFHMKYEALNKALSPLSAVYYSFVTGATLGYGDLYPVTAFGQFLVIAQLAIFVLFILLFVNYFTARSGEDE
ncbi:MAG: ion channel [Elusimicrobia bacterium]|nr:ion channel [Elusimicrobiota bacterium]